MKKNFAIIKKIAILLLFVFFSPAVAVFEPQLAPIAEVSVADGRISQQISPHEISHEASIIKIMDSSGRLSYDGMDILKGIEYNLQASNADIKTRGLFHNGISYILVSNPYDVPKTVVVNPQVSEWNLGSTQTKYSELKLEKIWNLLQITVPAFQSGLVIVQPNSMSEKSFERHSYDNSYDKSYDDSYDSDSAGGYLSEGESSYGYSSKEDASGRYSDEKYSDGKYSASAYSPKEDLSPAYSSKEDLSSAYSQDKYSQDRYSSDSYPSDDSYRIVPLISDGKKSSDSSLGEGVGGEQYSSIASAVSVNFGSEKGIDCQWMPSPIKIDAFGRLTIDGLFGNDFDLQPSSRDVLTRGLIYNGIVYILVANPCKTPKDVTVQPQLNNWYIQNVQVKYGTLMVSKVGSCLHITVPGCQFALVIITPQKKRYSFTAGPKPSYSFSAGPKPRYSFQAGPKPPYSFRIGY